MPECDTQIPVGDVIKIHALRHSIDEGLRKNPQNIVAYWASDVLVKFFDQMIYADGMSHDLASKIIITLRHYHWYPQANSIDHLLRIVFDNDVADQMSDIFPIENFSVDRLEWMSDRLDYWRDTAHAKFLPIPVKP